MRLHFAIIGIACLASAVTAGAATISTRPQRPDLSVCEQHNKDPWTCTFDWGGGVTAECHAEGTEYSLCKFSDGSLHGYSGNVCFPSPF